jgi:hypothetical protein
MKIIKKMNLMILPKKKGNLLFRKIRKPVKVVVKEIKKIVFNI